MSIKGQEQVPCGNWTVLCFSFMDVSMMVLLSYSFPPIYSYNNFTEVYFTCHIHLFKFQWLDLINLKWMIYAFKTYL